MVGVVVVAPAGIVNGTLRDSLDTALALYVATVGGWISVRMFRLEHRTRVRDVIGTFLFVSGFTLAVSGVAIFTALDRLTAEEELWRLWVEVGSLLIAWICSFAASALTTAHARQEPATAQLVEADVDALRDFLHGVPVLNKELLEIANSTRGLDFRIKHLWAKVDQLEAERDPVRRE